MLIKLERKKFYSAVIQEVISAKCLSPRFDPQSFLIQSAHLNYLSLPLSPLALSLSKEWKLGYGLDRWHGDVLMCPFVSSWARYIMTPGVDMEASTYLSHSLLSDTQGKGRVSHPPGWEDACTREKETTDGHCALNSHERLVGNGSAGEGVSWGKGEACSNLLISQVLEIFVWKA